MCVFCKLTAALFLLIVFEKQRGKNLILRLELVEEDIKVLQVIAVSCCKQDTFLDTSGIRLVLSYLISAMVDSINCFLFEELAPW